MPAETNTKRLEPLYTLPQQSQVEIVIIIFRPRKPGTAPTQLRQEAWVTTWDAYNDAVLAVVRHVEGRTVLGLFNFSSARQIARLDSDGDIELPAEVALEPNQV